MDRKDIDKLAIIYNTLSTLYKQLEVDTFPTISQLETLYQSVIELDLILLRLGSSDKGSSGDYE